MPDQSGRTVVITGANSGIGFEAARALAKKNAHVVLACRNLDKAHEAEHRIEAEVPGAALSSLRLDLADLSSVEAFASAFDKAHAQLDVLVNNAGVMALPKRTTADGFEMQLGVNHLGHFALTAKLLEKLLATPGSRVVNVSSLAHVFGRIRFHDLHWERRYSAWGAYGQSKLANLLFTFELDRRLKLAAQSTICVSCHPGWAATNLQEAGPKMAGSKVMQAVSALANAAFAQDAEEGAWPTLYAAVEPLEGKEFVGPTSMLGWRGAPAVVQPRPKARHPKVARRLWAVSEDLTGVRFPV